MSGRGSVGLGGWQAVRWALVIALAVGVVVQVAMVPREFIADQAASFYVINVAIDLVPALAYAVAVVLAISRRGGSLAWGVLLACGLALSAVVLFYAATSGFGELMLGPPVLVALCLVEMFAPVGSRATAAAR
jgi:hypothetical protein